ncbi:MAG: hypothetical protein CSB13_09195 [Chloroflexi bacterium]|nr:MAG: hypothetical protein CSB13_09195 [Chloroflexota bacterium]
MAQQFKVNLPIGYSDQDGHLHREATLRKMRGYDEELLYDENLNAGQLVTQLLASCIQRLGDIEVLDADIISELYTADRNYLLLELRRITLGNSLSSAHQCPQCGQSVTVVDDLSELEVTRLKRNHHLREITLTLEDGYEDRKGEVHRQMVLGLPKGWDEEFVAPMVRRNPLKAQDVLLLRCIKQFGSLSKEVLESYGVKILRELTIGDRQQIQHALSDGVPGVNFQRSLQCNTCGNRFEGMMDISGFFVLG